MALLELVSPETATGKVEEAYAFMEELAGMVPLPLQMLSPSPELLSTQIQTMKYLMNQPNLGFSLLAHIRLLVAKEENYPYCISLNQTVLQKFVGLSAEQVEASMEDPEKAALSPKEIAMLQFVLKVMRDPALTKKADIDQLHELGWTDTDILDAVQEGLIMMTRGIMFKAFKVAENAE
jgi:uncharacterized peroxidase-related enzyme